MSSSSTSSVPWRSLVGLALMAPTPIILLLQNTTNFVVTWHVGMPLMLGLVFLGMVCAIAATVLGYQATATDPRPLASFTFTVSALCVLSYAFIWIAVLHGGFPRFPGCSGCDNE